MPNDAENKQFIARQFLSYYEKNHLEPEEKAMIITDLELLL